MQVMKICVFGAGAVGGHIAAKLAAAGNEVSVVARGAHLEAMQSRGLRLIHGKQTIVGRVRAASSSRDLGVHDAVLVTLKANMLDAFAQQAAPLLGPETAVVFVQNGIPWWYEGAPAALDPRGMLRENIDMSRVASGVAYSANEVVEPGVVENHVPGNNMVVIGRPDKKELPVILRLREAMEKADISSPPVEDIRQAIWSKLAQNLGTSTLCTLTGLPVGEVRTAPGLKPIFLQAGAEARAVAAALGIDVSRAPARPGGGHTSSAVAHKPSMLQDYERGRPMEVAAQLTAPLAFARAAKIATPLLDVIVPLVAAKAAAKGLFTH
jgi:2-dehydropantoate 2-reductase